MNIGSREIVLWLSEPQHQALTQGAWRNGDGHRNYHAGPPGGAVQPNCSDDRASPDQPGDGGRAFGTAAAVGGKPDFLSVPDYGAWTGQLPDEGRLRRVSGRSCAAAPVSAPAE